MDQPTKRAARPKNQLHRDVNDLAYILMLGKLGARPNSICKVLSGDRWTEIKVGKVLKDYFGHGAKHGRRPIVATVEERAADVTQRTLAYLVYEIVSVRAECEAAAIGESYEVYHFMAQSLGYEPISIERFIPFAQGAERQNLRLVTCRTCSVPRLVQSHVVQSLFRCEDHVKEARKAPTRRLASEPPLVESKSVAQSEVSEESDSRAAE